MKRTPKVLLILVLIIFALVLTTLSIAQVPNDPTINEDANACYGGGTLAGVCNSTDVDFDRDVDQHDINWMWRCGWYLIRVEYGIYGEDVLDGICREIIEIVIVEEEDDDDDDDDEEEEEEEEEEVPEEVREEPEEPQQPQIG